MQAKGLPSGLRNAQRAVGPFFIHTAPLGQASKKTGGAFAQEKLPALLPQG